MKHSKKHRLDGETRNGGERAIATVNRELALLRSVLGFAKQSGWLTRSPFEQGQAIISTAVETKRERILTREEEERLLAVCECKERRHIRRSSSRRSTPERAGASYCG